MKIKKSLYCALLSTGLLTSATASARWFEIEVLLFARNQDPVLVAEDFPEQVAPLSSRNRVELLEFIYPPKQPCRAEEISPQPQPDVTQPFTQINAATDNTATLATNPDNTTLLQDAEHQEDQASCTEATLPLNQAPYSPLSASLPEQDESPYLLTQEMLQLSEVAARLQRHGVYRPLLHTGWRMDIDSKRNTPVLHLVAGRNYAEQFDQQGEPLLSKEPEVELSLLSEAASQATTTLLPEEADYAPAPIWELEANLKIWLATWLHVDTEMQLRLPSERTIFISPEPSDTVTEPSNTVTVPNDAALEPMPDESERQVDNSISLLSSDPQTSGTLVQQSQTQPFLQSYLMDQFKRVRSEEIHYFDHPLMGMLIQIRKFEPKVAQQPAQKPD